MLDNLQYAPSPTGRGRLRAGASPWGGEAG